MKQRKRWRPGGRPRQRADTRRWLNSRQGGIGGRDFEALQEELNGNVPRRRRKEG